MSTKHLSNAVAEAGDNGAPTKKARCLQHDRPNELSGKAGLGIFMWGETSVDNEEEMEPVFLEALLSGECIQQVSFGDAREENWAYALMTNMVS